jgi:hypothetical protein
VPCGFAIFWSVIVLLIVAFVWRFVFLVWTSDQPIEPADAADILSSSAAPSDSELRSGSVRGALR